MVSGSSSSLSLLLLAVILVALVVVSVVIVPLAVDEKELYDGAAAGLNALVDAASLLLLVVDAEIMLL